MTIIENGTLVESYPGRVRRGMDVVVEGSTIAAVGKGIAKEYLAKAKAQAGETGNTPKVIDGTDKIVMPGMVCSHHHYYSGLSRGVLAHIGPTPNFVETLRQLWWRVDRALDEESVYYSSLICSIDAIRSGTTAVIDHHASPSYIGGSLETIARGFEQVGLRGMTCYEVTDRNRGKKELEAGVAENVAFAKYVEKAKNDPTKPYLMESHIGGHAPFTISDYGLELMAQAVADTGKGIHLHIAEDKADLDYSLVNYGKRLLPRIDSFNLLNNKAILVHGIFLDEEEIALLNEKDAFLVHNARSNMNNGVGYNQNLHRYKNLAIGTDGIGADMFEEFKFAFFKHRDDRGAMWPDSYSKFLWNGNELLMRNFGGTFGVLEPGAVADITLLDYVSPTPLVAENVPGHLAFGMGSQSVDTVLVHGEVVMENREFPFDVQEIYAKAAESAEKMWKRMDTL